MSLASSLKTASPLALHYNDHYHQFNPTISQPLAIPSRECPGDRHSIVSCPVTGSASSSPKSDAASPVAVVIERPLRYKVFGYQSRLASFGRRGANPSTTRSRDITTSTAATQKVLPTSSSLLAPSLASLKKVKSATTSLEIPYYSNDDDDYNGPCNAAHKPTSTDRVSSFSTMGTYRKTRAALSSTLSKSMRKLSSLSSSSSSHLTNHHNNRSSSRRSICVQSKRNIASMKTTSKVSNVGTHNCSLNVEMRNTDRRGPSSTMTLQSLPASLSRAPSQERQQDYPLYRDYHHHHQPQMQHQQQPQQQQAHKDIRHHTMYSNVPSAERNSQQTPCHPHHHQQQHQQQNPNSSSNRRFSNNTTTTATTTAAAAATAATTLTTTTTPLANTHTSHGTSFIEIAPGLTACLRGAQETMTCVQDNFYRPVQCATCTLDMFCILDANYALCPVCKVVNPLMLSDAACPLDAVALGFTVQDLQNLQGEIITQRSRPQQHHHQQQQQQPRTRCS